MGVDRVDQLGHPLTGRADGGHDGRPPDRLWFGSRAVVLVRPGHHAGDVQHRLQIGHRLAGAIAVGLVDDEHVGDLHQPRLVGLDGIAPPRVDHDDGRVGGVDDVGLHLTDPNGLDDDPITPGRPQDGDGIVGCPGEPTEVAPGRHRPDVHVVVAGDVAHPHPIPQDGATGEGTGRIDGEHRHRPVAPEQLAAQRGAQRRLARAGRAGDAHGEGLLRCAVASALGPGGPDERRTAGPTPLNDRQGSGERPAVAVAGPLQQFVGVGRQWGHDQRSWGSGLVGAKEVRGPGSPRLLRPSRQVKTGGRSGVRLTG